MQIKTLILTSLFAVSSLAFAKVNINTATVNELSSLKGIGPSKAQAIITYRKKHGNFKNLSDLSKVKGIGSATTSKLKNEIALSGKTTVSKPAKK